MNSVVKVYAHGNFKIVKARWWNSLHSRDCSGIGKSLGQVKLALQATISGGRYYVPDPSPKRPVNDASWRAVFPIRAKTTVAAKP